MTASHATLRKSNSISLRPLAALAVVSSILLNLILLNPASSASQPRKILTGWIPYYSIKTSVPAAISNADLINEVMPFWYTLKFNTNTKSAIVKDLYESAKLSAPMSTPLNALRAAGIQIIPTITDGMAKLELSNLLSTPTDRTKTAQTIASLVIANNYDGIDLDFEGFAFVDGSASWAKTSPYWVAFIKELSTLLRANAKILSVTTPYNFNPTEKQKGYTVYAWPKIAPYIDRLRIMTYDYSVSKVGPIGPLAWTEKTVAYATSIMPASKVYLGIAGYGRDWVTKVEGICPAPFINAIKVGAKAATFVMRDAELLASSYQVTPVFNDKYGEATFTYLKSYEGLTADGRSTTCTAARTAWYQNSQSYLLRAELVAKYKIGGLTAWTLGMEEPMAMEAIRQVAINIAPSKVLSAFDVDNGSAVYGKVINLMGLLTLEDTSVVSNQSVRIEGKAAQDDNWRLLGLATTGADGKFSNSILLSRPMMLRLATDGTWDRAESRSNEIAVVIDRRISLSAPATGRSYVPIEISGVISPRSADSKIILMRYSRGTWKQLQTTLSSENGEFSFLVENLGRSIAKFQVIVEEDQVWQQVVAPEFSIIIR
jgi:spore germination protein YaaH